MFKVDSHIKDWVILLKSKREEVIQREKSLSKNKQDVHISQWKYQPAPEERNTARYLGRKFK